MTLSAESKALVEQIDKALVELHADVFAALEENRVQILVPAQEALQRANKHTRALGIRSRRKLQAYRDALQAEDPGCDDV